MALVRGVLAVVLAAAKHAKGHVQRRLLFDVVVAHDRGICEVMALEGDPQPLWRDHRLLLDFKLDSVDRVVGTHVDSDGVA